MKILLIYPNGEGYGRIPLALSIISACLKEKGHEVDLLDITFTASANLDNQVRESLGIAKKVDTSAFWGEVTACDYKALVSEKVERFKPDLAAITIIQNNYWSSLELLREVKRYGIPVIAGGTFASVCPDILLNSGLIDIVVRGEGEQAVVELVAALEAKKDFSHIDNCVYLKGKQIVTNPIRKYIDLNTIPFQDISLFDKRHLMKPFDGRMIRPGYFEFSRGCPYSCTYCANYFLNEKLYDKEKTHIRFKNIDRCIDEIEALNKQYGFNFIFFSDENILVLSKKMLETFAQAWKKRVNLPFYITTRVEFTSEEKVAILKDMGCATIAFGIEAGNEEFRRKVMKRYDTNGQIIKTFRLCKKYGIRTTANNIFGLPYETEKLMFDTIRLNIAAAPDSFSLAIFAPYMGTELYRICLEEGFIDESIPTKIGTIDDTILKMPQLSREKILETYYNFMKYFNGELKLPA